jgi:hypothetical protein
VTIGPTFSEEDAVSVKGKVAGGPNPHSIAKS